MKIDPNQIDREQFRVDPQWLFDSHGAETFLLVQRPRHGRRRNYFGRDMKETHTINVTAQDIETGAACNCFQCPVARAMMRQIPDVESVEARGAVLYYKKSGSRKGMRTSPPSEVLAFMEAFDSEQHVQPFSFTATFKSGEVDRDGKEQLHAI